MSNVGVAEARKNLASVIERAQREPVVIARRGRAQAVVVSPEHFDAMREALEEIEDARVRRGDGGGGGEPAVGAGEGRPGLGVSYRIELRPAAVRALRKADHQGRSRIKAAIALLARDPRPPRATALRGRDGFRVRVGDYRILYTINDDILLVVVVTLGHRREVYDR
nr:type II toxin-antitoxin system prevent-host-death family antitoxin [Candidatus Microthrix sp.]